MRSTRLLSLALLGGLVACQGGLPGLGDDDDDGGPDAGPAGPDVVFVDPVAHLVRASMALRGMRPSLAEIEAVAADPAALEGIIDGYLESPEFGETMRDLHNEALLTRDFILPAVEDLAGYSAGRIGQSLGEEPLRLVEHVIMNDRPYTEIVTADYTVADEVVAKAYGLTYDPAGAEWQETHYTDGRPEAGILSSSTLFLRHRSAGQNWHRGRANQISQALLCYNFLDRDVVLDQSINLADPEVVRNAVVQNPACASCHQTLDPLASYFWGFAPNVNLGNIATYPVPNMYVPANEGRWQNTSRRPPSYFGQETTTPDLRGLGEIIAEDPRFSMCAATRFYAYMAQVELDAVPLGLASRLQSTFVDTGYSAKALAKAVVMSDEFRVSHATSDGVAEDVVGLKKARPEQLARLFFQLTGFRWRTQSNVQVRGAALGLVEVTTNDVVGFRVLAGGIDSEFVLQPSHTFNATSSLFLRAFAAEAAGFVVERDLAEPDPAERRLLDLVEATTTDETAVRVQLARLHARLYGELVAPDDESVTLTWTLFSATLARTGDVKHAWKTTLTAMLQDLRIATF
jgi:hypothetical protein